MKVDREMIRAARKIDLVSFLQMNGFTLKKDGKNYRVKDFSGVLVKDNMYTDFVRKTAGNALDFCVNVLELSVPEAVMRLLDHRKSVQVRLPNPEKEMTMFTLPEANCNHRRVIAYLTQTRGISSELVIELIRKKLLFQDLHGNAVFICRDEQGEAREAIIRGTLTEVPFKKRIGTGRYPFVLYPDQNKRTLVVTEAPIETLSIITLYPQSKYCIHAALGGVGLMENVEGLLTLYPNIKRVIGAFNNDSAGIIAGEQLTKLYRKRVEVVLFYPQNIGDDWNETLLSTKKRR